jgi:hypothetical protein
MKYKYPIKVNYEPKNIRYEKEIYLGDQLLTLGALAKYMKEGETFDIVRDCHSGDRILKIHCVRMEKEEERKKRVSKEEKYMMFFRSEK